MEEGVASLMLAKRSDLGRKDEGEGGEEAEEKEEQPEEGTSGASSISTSAPDDDGSVGLGVEVMVAVVIRHSC